MRQHLPASVFRQRPISLAIGLLVVGPASFALPQGATPTAGQATVSVTAPGQMSIVQGTAKAGLDWTSFSIAAGESVNVVQPGRSAVLLNRVLGDDPSRIYGSLTSNGSVWLINPRGIVFGATSRVDVGGLLASTLGLNNQTVADALASGRLQLGAGAGTPGELRAEGSITATDGSAVLVSPRLLQSGSITARRVGLAAASDVLVDVEGDGLIFFNVRNDRLDARLDQLGTVRADGGLAEMRAAARSGFADTVLNLDGIVQARSIGVQQGRIVIDGGSSGITRVAGTLDATAAAGDPNGKGGQVLLQGDKILLDTAALLDASGSAGGGSVLVGGDYQGSNPDVRNASMVAVRQGARLAANALDHGDGGKVIVWSDDATRFLGAADARGGAHGGNGGLVEVSGKAYLDFRGTSDRSAPYGQAGLLLLDPGTLFIGTVADIDSDGLDLTTPTLAFGAAGLLSSITAVAVENQLRTGPVSLQARDDIFVTTAINAGSIFGPQNQNTSLELLAGNRISITAAVSVSGSLTLSAGDPRTTPTAPPVTPARVEISAPLSAGETITITNNGANNGGPVHQIGASLTAATLAITGPADISGASTWTLSGDSTLNGAIGGSASWTKAGAGTLTLGNAANGYAGPLAVSAGGLTLNGTLAAATTLDVASGATLTLGVDQNVTSLNLSGTLAGGSARTLTTSGNSTLHGGSTLTTALAADTLATDGSVTLTTAVGLTQGASIDGTLTVGDGAGNGALTAGGTLTLLNSGTTLVYKNTAAVALGAVTGAGTLRQEGSGGLTLNGLVDTGAIQIVTGTLATAATANRIGSSTSVAADSGSIFSVAGTESIGALTLNGATASGSGALTATSFTSTGTSTLATGVNVAVLGPGSTSTINGGRLNVADGGALTGATVTLNNAELSYQHSTAVSVGAVTGTGTLLQDGAGLLTLTGLVDTTSINVAGGNLATAAAGGSIGSGTAVTVGSGRSLTVAGTESIGALTLNGASVGGSGPLTATVLTSTGASTLATALTLTSAAAQEGNATVASGGSLTLTDGGSLAFGTAGKGVLLQTNSTLAFNGSANTAFSIGDVTGPNSGSSTLQVQGGSLTLNGVVSQVSNLQASNAANLTTAAAGRIGSGTAVSIGTGSFTLGGAETVASLALAGTVTGGSLSTGTLATTGTAQVSTALTVTTGTTISSGSTLTIGAGNAGSLAGTADITLADSTSTLTFAGSLAHTLDANVLGAGTLRQSGSNTLTLNGTANALTLLDLAANTGAVVLAASGAQLGNPSTVTVAGNATLQTTSASNTVATLNLSGTLAGGGTLATVNGSTLTGGAVSGTLGGNVLVSTGISALSGSLLGNVTLANNGVLQLNSGGSLASGSAVSVNSGSTLTLNVAGVSVDSFSLAGTLDGSGTLTTLGSGSTLFGNATVGSNATLAGGTVHVTGNATVNGRITSPRLEISGNGTTLLLGPLADRLDNQIVVDIGSGSTLQLQNNETIGTLTSNGSITGAGFTLSTNLLALNGNSVNLGNSLTTQTLTSSGTSSILGDLRVVQSATVNDGTLTVGNGGTVGTLTVDVGGTLTVNPGARLAYNHSDSVTLGDIVGGGRLVQLGSGPLVLGGSVALPFIDIDNGLLTLATGSGDRLTDANVQVAVGANGAFRLANASEGIHTLLLNGQLQAGGVLTADSATLGAGNSRIDGALSTGALVVDAAAVVNNTVTLLNSGSVVVHNGGTLGLTQAAGRLAGTGTLQVDSGGRATLGANTTVTTLDTAGRLDGDAAGSAFTLTASSGSTLRNGALVDTNLAGGPLLVTGDSTLNGRALLTGSNATASISGGTLTLGSAADRLRDIAVSVATSGGLALNSDQTLGTLTLAGSLAGNGHTLTAASYTLQDQAQVNGALGSGTLTSNGAVTLANTAAASTVAVQSGTLTLNGSNLLASAAGVSVGSGATLALAGDNTVATLALQGTLAGSGRTLTTNSTTLQAGNVTANLATGTLTVNSAGTASTLAGSATVGTLLTVNSGGSLTLVGGGRLPGAPSAAINGLLTLGGDETLGALSGSGSVQLVNHTLTTGNAATGTFGGTLAGSGNLVKVGSGSFTLAGNNGYTGSTSVNAGTLVLVGTSASGQLLVSNNATLQLNAANLLADSASVTVGSNATLALGGNDTLFGLALDGLLAGAGTLTATDRYVLNGGRTNLGANLGGGWLQSSGASQLGGSSAATRVDVDAGTLTLNGSNRLTGNSATVTVANQAVLALVGSQALAGSGSSLALGGQLQGGLLTAASYGLDGGNVAVSASLGGGALTSTGSSTLTGSSAASSVSVNGGTLTLASANRLTAAPTVNVAGTATLAYNGVQSTGALTLAGTLQGDGNGIFSAPTTTLQGGTVAANARLGAGTLAVTADSLLAGTSAASTVAIGDSTHNARLTLGSANRLASTATVTVAGNSTLRLGGDQTITRLNLSGSIDAMAGVPGTLTAGVYALDGGQVNTALGAGLLTATGTSTLNAPAAAATVQVTGGTLTLAASNMLLNTAAVAVASGAVLNAGADATFGSLVLNGTLNGVGTLTAASYTLNGGTVNGNLGSGALVSTGSSTVNGSAAVGTLAVNSGTLTLAGGDSLSNAPATTLGSTATLALSGNEVIGTLAGSGTLALGNFTLTTGAAGNSTFSGAITGGTGNSSGNLVKVGSGSFTLAGANSYGGATTVQAGTLATTTANALPDSSAVSVASGATLLLGGNDTVASLLLAGTLNGSGTLTAATYTLDGGNANANLGAGLLTSFGNSFLNGTSGAGSVLVSTGTLTLGSADRLADNANVRILSGATLLLNGNDTIGTLDLSGTVAGTGALNTSSTLLNGGIYNLNFGTGTLTSIGNSQLNGSSAAAVVRIDSGTLTLGSAHRFSASPALTVAGGAALVLGGDELFGLLAGAGNVNLGAFTLSTGALGDSVFSGVLSGSGTGGLTKLGSGVFTLAGSNSYGGATTVAAGTLATSGADVLPDASAVSVASGATLALGGNDTVASLVLAGSLNGTATLTAASTSLAGGTANANLGAGTLTSSGASLLNGTASAGSVAVTSGTLTLGSADRLADTAAVQVASGATLVLAGNDSIGSLQLAGTLNGSGTLSATSHALSGGTVNAALGGGSLTSSGNSTLNASAALSSLRVDGGTLTLLGAQRLTALPAVDVASGATLLLGGDQTAGLLTGTGRVNLASFTLATGSAGDSGFGGVLSGNGGLIKQGAATSFTLAGNNSYSGATRVDGGTLLLAGTLASNPVTVAGGSLVLAAADRLADTASVNVASGARFTLAGDERIGALTLAGTLDGSGTLSAATVALQGGTANANLGGGALTASGASVLNGSSAASSVAVNGGTLLLGSANRLTALPAVNIASGALLQFGGAQTLGTLAGSGTLDLGSSSLNIGSSGDTTFAGVLQGTGGLVKQGGSTLTLAGANTYTGATSVNGGSLRLSGTLASTQLAVNAGTLALLGADRLADGAAVGVASGATVSLAGNDTIASLVLAGTLAGSGTLTAGTYTLTGATVQADLGSGTLTSSGSTRLNGRAGAGSVTVLDGTLALGSADRLADSAAVAVQAGATLALNGNDTVGTLALAGTLASTSTGSGSTLTAANVALDGATVNANLGAGALVSSGNSVLNGTAAASSLLVNSGTLTLGAAQRLTALPAVSINNAAVLALAGDQAFGTLAGAGNLQLGSFTLTTGSGGDSIFAGAASGSGGLVKQGASVFTLSGSNSYTGATAVQAGTLRIGDGGTGGNVAGSSGFVVDGTLRFAHSDDVALAQAVSGSGVLEQAGSGRLLLSGSNKSHSGGTVVSSGELATAGADVLPDNGAVRVATGARLTLGGRETLRTLEADGAVALGGDLTASGDLLLRGAVTVAGSQAVALSGQRITADNDGNVWGSSLAINAGGLLTLSSGLTGAAGSAHRDLVLGTLTAAAGGRIDAGMTTLSAVTTLSGGTLALVSSAPRGLLQPDVRELGGKVAASLPIAYAEDAVLQTAASRISVASGAALQVTASNGGSVQLLNDGNSFMGTVAVRSGAAQSPWAVNATQGFALQSRVRVAGTTVNIGGDGIEADVVHIRADHLATVGSTSTIVARLPFDSTLGTAVSLPALTLELTPQAFNTPFPFGAPGVGNGLRVNVGSKAWGNRTLPLDAGYITVLPRGGASGSTAVLLEGPAVNLAGGYRFFFDGAGRQGDIPVFYNGVLPTTPQVENSISATVAVSEAARRERFEEAIRTENVAVRLRAGVIAEVGPAPSATQGPEGVRVPATCPPAGNTLLCPVPQGPVQRTAP